MSEVDFGLTAEIRSDKGKGASRRLRKEGKVPAIIYGGKSAPQSLLINHNEIYRHLQHESFYSHILEITINGSIEKAVLKDLQRHPAKDLIMHADFLRVDESASLRLSVPLHFINGDKAPGVKIGGGMVTHNLTEVEISCLPKDLPEFIEVDLVNLELDHSIHLTDLVLPAGVTIVALQQGEDHDLPVVTIHKTRGAIEADAADNAAAE